MNRTLDGRLARLESQRPGRIFVVPVRVDSEAADIERHKTEIAERTGKPVSGGDMLIILRWFSGGDFQSWQQ